MADLIIFAMAIVSAVSLLIEIPHEAPRKVLCASRKFGDGIPNPHEANAQLPRPAHPAASAPLA